MNFYSVINKVINQHLMMKVVPTPGNQSSLEILQLSDTSRCFIKSLVVLSKDLHYQNLRRSWDPYVLLCLPQSVRNHFAV